MVKVLHRAELEPRVAVIVGTRPGIIKLSPVIRELRTRSVPFVIIHTGQHYSPELDAVFFRDLRLPAPDVQLPAMSAYTLHGEQTAEMLKGAERALIETRPRAALVGGDANTNLSAALAARKLNIQVCHDEAGLRSYDWLMPEEHNRVIMDHIAEFLFVPNEDARATLLHEHVRGRIHVTGTTIVDAVAQNRVLAEESSDALSRLGLEPNGYLLMTTHHEETVDYPETLAAVLRGAEEFSRRSGKRILFPAHPRTRKRLVQFGLSAWVEDSPAFQLVEPLGYLDFLTVHANAALMLTDSGGGIQEACLLHVPCVTLGRVTEWQGTVEVGANLVCGTETEDIVAAADIMLRRDRDWPSPFGPPGAAARIVDVLVQEALTGEGFLPARPEVGDVRYLTSGKGTLQ
jgi:UDP-N-acetylglucosamine 2-epimerase (non-hydrolysing)